MGSIHVVVGGQFGSEGKGHVTAWLTASLPASHVVRVAGPNAGHSAYDQHGQKWALRQVPIAAVINPDVRLYIAAGSEIDPEVLWNEVQHLELAGHSVVERLSIDESATVIEPHHLTDEATAELTKRVGSTGKGIGAARSDRLMRVAKTWGQYVNGSASDERKDVFRKMTRYSVATLLYNHLDQFDTNIVVEGTQGYGLGLHTEYYPQCTSSDARAIDFLAMVGLSPWQAGVNPYIYPVFRTYPIRVAGNSGPMHRELDWADLAEQSGGHIQPERTTVTQKVRRVGEWDDVLAVNAMRANGGPGPNVMPILLFLDYVFPDLAGQEDHSEWGVEVWDYLRTKQDVLRSSLFAVGTGPDTIVRL